MSQTRLSVLPPIRNSQPLGSRNRATSADQINKLIERLESNRGQEVRHRAAQHLRPLLERWRDETCDWFQLSPERSGNRILHFGAIMISAAGGFVRPALANDRLAEPWSDIRDVEACFMGFNYRTVPLANQDPYSGLVVDTIIPQRDLALYIPVNLVTSFQAA